MGIYSAKEKHQFWVKIFISFVLQHNFQRIQFLYHLFQTFSDYFELKWRKLWYGFTEDFYFHNSNNYNNLLLESMYNYFANERHKTIQEAK